jgi:hypothetical protein
MHMYLLQRAKAVGIRYYIELTCSSPKFTMQTIVPFALLFGLAANAHVADAEAGAPAIATVYEICSTLTLNCAWTAAVV